MTREIRVHIDTLEYTREGLRTRAPLPLQTGHHHKVVLVRPDRVPAVSVQGVGFAQGSAFPLPGTLCAFWSSRPRRAPFTYHAGPESAWGASDYQIYGHCDNDEANAKLLSERRARVGEALLLRDHERFHSLARDEHWGIAEAQSMLRYLACDPGPVDGKAERLTLDGLKQFTTRYNRGVYHRESDRTPSVLAEPQDLSPDHQAALREAFVLVHGAGLFGARLVETNPSHGCAAFNAASSTPSATKRRLTILGYAQVPELIENAPCKTGDESSCALVDERPMRCMWFREHVRERPAAPVAVFDPRWLWLGKDRYVLSALTSADDGEPVEFEVSDAGAPARQPTVLQGVVRGGVAAVVWASHHEPLRDDGHPPHQERPVFTVRHPRESTAVTSAPWPERHDVVLFQFSEEQDRVLKRSGGVRLLGTDGSYEHFTPFAKATRASPRHLALRFPNVPSQTRLDMRVESGPLHRNVVRGMLLEELRGNIQVSEDSISLAPPPGPPSYDLDEMELGENASVGSAIDTPTNDF